MLPLSLADAQQHFGPRRSVRGGGVVVGGGAEHWNHPTDVFLWLLCRSRISARVSGGGGGGVNEGFNSFLSRAVIELNSHRRAGSSARHQPFPPISGSRQQTGPAAGFKITAFLLMFILSTTTTGNAHAVPATRLA